MKAFRLTPTEDWQEKEIGLEKDQEKEKKQEKVRVRAPVRLATLLQAVQKVNLQQVLSILVPILKVLTP